MKEIVEGYGVGVCAETDGSEQDKIIEAIKKLLYNLKEYEANIDKAKSQWFWNVQERTIKNIVERYLQ